MLKYQITMWKLLFLLLATAAASDDYEEDYDCTHTRYRECEVGGEPHILPGTEEELQEYCKFALKYLECIDRIMEHCNVDDISRAHLREMNTAANRICVNDSLLYSALANSLPCIKQNEGLFHRPCARGETYSTLLETLESVGVTDFSTSDVESTGGATSDFVPTPCLRFLYNVGCFASNVGNRCGDVAREVVVDIIEGFDMRFKSCPPGMKHNLRQIARVMQVEADKGETMENEIKKRK